MATKIDNEGINTPAFEAIIDKIETLIVKMESDHVTLSSALKAFESGIKLTQLAQKSLAKAEQKVQLLQSSEGEPLKQRFAGGSRTE